MPPMDVSEILNPLNEAQRNAVTVDGQHALILAGAGSGKTRVLVHRISWLIEVEKISPYAVLAVTFTNKAAAEMRGRIESLLGIPVGSMWVGTFHGLAHRLLRTHWQDASLPQGFQILDSQDQQRIIKRLIKAMDLDDSQWPAKQAQGFINSRKDEGLRAAHIEDRGDPYLRQMVKIYQGYEDICQRGGLIDFAELLLRALELWRNKPEILNHYRGRFSHILVDEFQDTNSIQYAWIQMLAGRDNKLFVVGDDDQSIYGWRGAKIENIQRFSKDFTGTQTFRLEQNYRSTANILNAANALIENNTSRLGKKLWTDGSNGEPIQLYRAFNDIEEARYVIEQIAIYTDLDMRRSDHAILYRSNAQSRLFEEALLARGIAYRVYGGLRFYERAEIKNALAYLRLMSNRHDDASFERVVNLPTRGIGERSLQAIRDHSRDYKVSLWDAACALCHQQLLASRAISALSGFVSLIEKLANDCDGLDLGDTVELVVEHTGLIEHFKKDKGERGQARIENLEELGSAARQFQYDESMDMAPLDAFLSHASLEAGESAGNQSDDCVQLMTLHSAKGLEFPTVFLCGVEEGLFPHKMSINEPGRLEEERRLCYVGITRARQRLYITHAETRRIHGSETFAAPSRFINEIPTELIKEIRPKQRAPQTNTVRRTRPQATGRGNRQRSAPIDDAPLGLRLGQQVAHPKFGEGTIMSYEGQGSQARIQINFNAAGSKWLVAAYANLQAI